MAATTPSGRRVDPVTHLFRATRHSLRGLAGAFASELAFRLDVLLFVALTPLALWLGKTGIERALLIGSMLLLLIVELLNTGIEKAIDRISLEHHRLSGLAKDTASAAVFCALVNVVAVWLLVLW